MLADRKAHLIVKQISALAVSAVLLLSLFGCGKGSEEDKPVTKKPAETSAVSETTASQETASKNDTDWGREIRGTVEDNVYTSGIGDFKLTLDDGWTFISDKEMAQKTGFSSENYNEEAWLDYSIGDRHILYDAWAENEDSSTIMVMIENVGTDASEIKKTEQAYANLLAVSMRAQLDDLMVGEFKDVTVNGSNCYWGILYGKNRGVVTELGYLIKRIDDYMICICISSLQGCTESCTEILNKFDGVEGLDSQTEGDLEKAD